jgi:hypothetical protein
LSPADAPVDSRAIRNPRATISDVGEIVIAWTQDDGAGSVPVYIAHRTGLGVWTVPAGLGDAFSVREGRAVSAQPAFGADAEVFLVWAQDRGSGHAVWSAHRRGDGTWDVPGTAPELLSTLGAEAVEPRLSVGVDGQAGVLWQERTDDSWRVMVRRRNPGADRWSAARQLSADDGRDATAPTLAIGPTGAALAAWLTGAPSRRRVTVVTTQLPRDPDDP